MGEYANYQTLFGKDYYVILRPALKLNRIINDDLNDNSQIDIGDLLMLYRHIAQNNNSETALNHPDWKLSDDKLLQGDLNKNGRLDIGDGLKIQRYIAAKNNTEVANQHPDWLVLE